MCLPFSNDSAHSITGLFSRLIHGNTTSTDWAKIAFRIAVCAPIVVAICIPSSLSWLFPIPSLQMESPASHPWHTWKASDHDHHGQDGMGLGHTPMHTERGGSTVPLWTRMGYLGICQWVMKIKKRTIWKKLFDIHFFARESGWCCKMKLVQKRVLV